ncbi:hypothetical protein AAY80_244 [Stenotrophomonas phage vB_SmaS-DLP_6]|nr:hypothetical protein AAY80_244 [Stenotrophomonas phage vB_SmaS-DLP_6]
MAFATELAALRTVAERGTAEEQALVLRRLLDGLATLDRMDVYYRESGCDCCSGDYTTDVGAYGEYVQSDELIGALRDAAFGLGD